MSSDVEVKEPVSKGVMEEWYRKRRVLIDEVNRLQKLNHETFESIKLRIENLEQEKD